jgi:hypothetical protein
MRDGAALMAIVVSSMARLRLNTEDGEECAVDWATPPVAGCALQRPMLAGVGLITQQSVN